MGSSPRLEYPRSARDRGTGLLVVAYIVAAFVLGAEGGRVAALLVGDVISPIASGSANAILSAIASGMMALTAILFSLLFVAIQVSGSAFSPRLVRVIGATRFLGHALGVFCGTFVYALFALRTIDIGKQTGINVFVIVIAFAWLLGSIVVLILLLPRVRGLSIGDVLATLYEQTAEAARRVYGGRTEGGQPRAVEPGSRMIIRYLGPPLYVRGFDVELLMRCANDANVEIRLPFAIGDPILPGEPLALVTPSSRTVDERRLRKAIWLGRERVVNNDPAYGIRLLVDVAIRALSPAVNDPTTAVMVIDQLEGLLRVIGERDIECNEVRDGGGVSRLSYEVGSWDDLLSLALTEIDQYGRDSRQVQARLASLLDDLEATLPETRRAAIRRVANTAIQPIDRWPRGASDRQGLGHSVTR